MQLKLSGEEIRAICHNLVAIDLVIEAFDVNSLKLTIKISKNGMKAYATLLDLLGKQKVLNGPRMQDTTIQEMKNESSKRLLFSQKFIDITSTLDTMNYEIVLTKRGVEQITVMFDLHQKSYVDLTTKINRFLTKLGII